MGKVANDCRRRAAMPEVVEDEQQAHRLREVAREAAAKEETERKEAERKAEEDKLAGRGRRRLMIGPQER